MVPRRLLRSSGAGGDAVPASVTKSGDPLRGNAIEDDVDLFALILLDDPVREVAELQPATAFVMLMIWPLPTLSAANRVAVPCRLSSRDWPIIARPFGRLR
jgi:hypothetical protein